MQNSSIPKADVLFRCGVKKIKEARLAITLGLSLLIMVFGVSGALAIEYGDLGGRPAYPRPDNPRTESIFVHTLEPGDVKQEGVMMINNSAGTKTLLVYAVDSTPSTGGAFACEQFSQAKDDVGAWIALEKSEITLEPSTNEIIPFKIAVPLNADVGEHNGCVIIQEKIEKPSDKSGVRLSFRTGLRVAITIPGELIRRLEIAGFNVERKDAGDFLLQPKVKNLGNVSIDADVRVATRYFFGLTLASHGGQYPILRGDTSDWNFELKKPFWGGWYYSSFTVEYDANPEAAVGVKSGKALTRLAGPTVWFFSFPAPAGLAIEATCLLLLITCLFLLWLSRKRKRWIKKNWVSYEVKSGEDIRVLAKRFKVSWKLIAKANRLRPPYTFKSGEKIKVPPTK